MDSGIDETIATPSAASEPDEVLTLAEERAHIEKRDVVRGKVIVHKRVGQRTETVDEPLRRETVEIERVLLNRLVDGTPPVVHEENGVTIIPILKEVLVTEKRLMLVEEIRMYRKQTTYHNPQKVTLRHEYIEVERTDNPPAPVNTDGGAAGK